MPASLPVSECPDLVFDRRGALGIVRLDRPKALNALSLPMIEAMTPALDAFADDPDIGAVLIEGAGEKAFCAGGDVRLLYDEGQAAGMAVAPDSLRARFFRAEYTLNHRIHTFPKPVVAIMDGITMGGGVGLSRHATVRVATERTMIAMPETGIGLFPDIGGGWFLPRCPGEIGTYLGLTGHRMQAADALFTGFATHVLDSAAVPGAIDALGDLPASAMSADALSAILALHQTDPGTAPLSLEQATINRLFSADTLPELTSRLQADGTDFARSALQTLGRMSPTSLAVTLRQLRQAASLPYNRVVTMEYRLSQAAMAHPDFYEGIRALLVDKDRSPKWNPSAIDAIDDAAIDRHFGDRGVPDLIVG